jgi:hypothetical protein
MRPPHRFARRRRGSLLVLTLALGLLCAMPGPAASADEPPRVSADPRVPPGVTAGVAVFDRQTGAFTEQINPDLAFRSASVVKLLLTLDFFWDRGPDYDLPAADRARLEPMLRSSNDAAASHYWSARGGSAIIERMTGRLGLTGTLPPPATHPGFWGYTALTAADTVRIYRYILDTAPAPVRAFIMDNLHAATRCADDGYDQYFGVASAFEQPFAVKQGWSGFSSGGCTARPSAERERGDGRPDAKGADGLDLVSEALHSTGTVGADDRTVVAVLTLHPDGTSYGAAYSAVTRLVGELDVPGAERPTGTRFATWGSGVRVRSDATTSSAALTTLPAGVEVLVGCQKRGGAVSVPPYENDWWAFLPQYGGWMTNIYLDSPGNQLPGVPVCT